jgi:cullin 3
MRRTQAFGSGEADFEGSWTVLSTAFSEIHHKNASRLSFEELFRSAYKLVLKKRHEELYGRVTAFEQSWLRDTVKQRVADTVTSTLLLGADGQSNDVQAHERRVAGDRFMTVLKDAYQDQHMCMNMITDVLMYMVSVPTCSSFPTMLTVQGPSI